MVCILQESNWDHTRCSSKVSETSFEGQFGQGLYAIGNLKMGVIRMVDGGRCQLPIRLGYYVFNKWVCLDTNWRVPCQKSDAGIGQLILGGAKHCNLKTWRIDACKSCKCLLWESEKSPWLHHEQLPWVIRFPILSSCLEVVTLNLC